MKKALPCSGLPRTPDIDHPDASRRNAPADPSEAAPRRQLRAHGAPARGAHRARRRPRGRDRRPELGCPGAPVHGRHEPRVLVLLRQESCSPCTARGRSNPREAPEVHMAIARLSRRAGIPEPRVFYVPDPAPNAFATGRNPEHAAVAVTDGLLRLLDAREIEAVIGHELSHVLNRDILISSIAATMAGAISLLARFAGYALMLGRGGSNQDGRRNPLAALFMIIVAPIIALLLQLAVSRSREFGADATGARLCGDPEALASALAKLHTVAREVPMRTADPATAHMYIVAPLSGLAGSIVELFSTHPRVEERIRRLRAMR
ncbi:MAG: M48 family metalloprotease [Minicystis sp.]